MTVAVPHIAKGSLVEGKEREYSSGGVEFVTPALDLDALVWPRTRPGPLFDVPSAEIVDSLVATGEALRADRDGVLHEAMLALVEAGPLQRRIAENSYAQLHRQFAREALEFQLEQELGGVRFVDGWHEITRPDGRIARVRAFPSRLVHILAGNAPGVATQTIVRSALTKSVSLLKLPSNDLFTASAVLRCMIDALGADHPLPQSFSVAYWRGGDTAVEGTIFRPQFFDKLVAWGGEAAIRGALQYVGPGFELVSFDPKSSISVIGREAFASDETLAEAATLAAIDATPYNQAACTSARFQFVEGDEQDVDRFCALLQQEMGVDRPTASAIAGPVPLELRGEIDGLRDLEPFYRVWGSYNGEGLVIRSDEPVGFYPDNKVVNVVRVDALADVIPHVTVATQTVGVYPPERKVEIRDAAASAGAQRVVSLGSALGGGSGIPHDGFYPLHRFVRWVNDED